MTDDGIVAEARSERGQVVLRRRGRGEVLPPVLELRVNGVFVMDTEHTRTERRLAERVLDCVAEPRRLVVGGLGLGFTLARLLEDPRVRDVRVAEIEPAVVEWIAAGRVPQTRGTLADERVHVQVADVRRLVGGLDDSSVDGILLDVDNGPGYLVFDHNAEVYRAGFVRECVRVLRPQGVLAVWSSAPAPELAHTLREATRQAWHERVPVMLQGRETSHHLYLGRPAV